MHIQSIIIPKSNFTKKKAYEWIKLHGFKTEFGNKKGPDITKNFFRFRQRAPSKKYHYYVKALSNGIKLVLYDK